jgi:hypothetical protein
MFSIMSCMYEQSFFLYMWLSWKMGPLNCCFLARYFPFVSLYWYTWRWPQHGPKHAAYIEDVLSIYYKSLCCFTHKVSCFQTKIKWFFFFGFRQAQRYFYYLILLWRVSVSWPSGHLCKTQNKVKCSADKVKCSADSIFFFYYGVPPFVDCPRLLIQYVPRYHPYWRPFLHPQP